ncbi:hypothetical protein [Chitinophaga lutea]
MLLACVVITLTLFASIGTGSKETAARRTLPNADFMLPSDDTCAEFEAGDSHYFWQMDYRKVWFYHDSTCLGVGKTMYTDDLGTTLAPAGTYFNYGSMDGCVDPNFFRITINSSGVITDMELCF